jgi:hypothetical protein
VVEEEENGRVVELVVVDIGRGVEEIEEEERVVEIVGVGEEEIVVGSVVGMKVMAEVVDEFSARRLYRVGKPSRPRKSN